MGEAPPRVRRAVSGRSRKVRDSSSLTSRAPPSAGTVTRGRITIHPQRLLVVKGLIPTSGYLRRLAAVVGEGYSCPPTQIARGMSIPRYRASAVPNRARPSCVASRRTDEGNASAIDASGPNTASRPTVQALRVLSPGGTTRQSRAPAPTGSPWTPATWQGGPRAPRETRQWRETGLDRRDVMETRRPRIIRTVWAYPE
jgi:hypothetical protein